MAPKLQEAILHHSTFSACSGLEHQSTPTLVVVRGAQETLQVTKDRTMRRTAKAGWCLSLLWASGPSTLHQAQGKMMATFRPSSTLSPASPLPLPRLATTRTYCGRHRTAHASATGDVPPWAASISHQTTTAKDTTVPKHRSDPDPGHHLPTLPQAPSLHPPPLPPMQGSLLTPLERQRQLLRFPLRRRQRNLRFHRGAEVLSAGVQARPLSLPRKSRRRTIEVPDSAV
jgi:hypothetical protein